METLVHVIGEHDTITMVLFLVDVFKYHYPSRESGHTVHRMGFMNQTVFNITVHRSPTRDKAKSLIRVYRYLSS
jgi:hypothetical protein